MTKLTPDYPRYARVATALAVGLFSALIWASVTHPAVAADCLLAPPRSASIPCITRVVYVGGYVEYSWATPNGTQFDFYITHWTPYGQSWRPQHTVNSGGANGSDHFVAQPGMTYSFGVDGCNGAYNIIGGQIGNSHCTGFFDVNYTVGSPPAGPVAGSCRTGFVWRGALPNDYVCVVPSQRDQAAADNAQAAFRFAHDDICKQGYVWREAVLGDHVCVTPQTRAQVAADNQNRASRTAN